MLEIEKRRYIFKTKEIWFADYPYDVNGFAKVVFRDCKNRINLPGFNYEEYTTLVIDLNQDLEQIWKNMSKSACRYGINRAKKEGAVIRLNQDFKEFFKINRSFRKAKGLSPSETTVDFIKEYGILFVAEFDGEILGGQLYLKDKNNIRWLMGASKRLEVNREKAILISNANRLIIWEATKYAKEKGIKEFDFGGYYSGGKGNKILDTPNIFKQNFGGKITIRYVYQKNYSKTYKILSSLKQKSFS